MIKYLKKEISCGYDEIFTRILKINSPFISTSSNNMFNEL